MSALPLGVSGSDTGVGKTLVSAGLVGALRARGLDASACKPVATGVATGTAGEDAELLGLASGKPAADCVLATFKLPRSPMAAAQAEGRAIDVEELAQALLERARAHHILVIEGVGGILVPVGHRATVQTLFRRLDARTLIVGRAGLGTVNHCALTVDACRSSGLRVLGVVLSDVEGVADEFARENAEQIARQCGVPVFGVLPHLVEPSDARLVARVFAERVDVDAILDAATSGGDLRQRVITADRKHVWHPFTQTSEWLTEDPPVIRSGEGCWLIDEDGRRYLDGVGSLWANVHGHAHPVLDRALREQAGRIAHSTFLGSTHEPGALLAEELAALTPPGLTRVFYSESGAAAVEVALRVALLAQLRRGQPRRTRFISLDAAYHGDTAGAASVGRSEAFHSGLDPLLFDVVRVPSPYVVGEDRALGEFRRALDASGETIAAFIIEPRIQGAAGMLPHSDAWLRAAAGVARRSGALVVCDEVATGFGRTGDLFACTGAAATPDVLVLGKGLSGGYLPLSATVMSDELYELFTGEYAEQRTLYYGHTYSGNPLACAVARASLQLFEREDTVAQARSLSAALGHRLAEIARLPPVHDVRQRGVMVGIELSGAEGTSVDPRIRAGRSVTLAARRRGVIVRPLGDVVVLNPPLVMSEREADVLVSAVGEAIDESAHRVPALAAG